MYTSNWTEMNLKTKKLLLLSMQMENANKSMIKISSKKIVNLQLFANVIINTRVWVNRKFIELLFAGNDNILQYRFGHVEITFLK